MGVSSWRTPTRGSSSTATSRPRHRPLPAARPGLLGAAAALHRHLRELPRGRGMGHPQGHRLQPAQGGLHARGPRVRPPRPEADDEQELFELQTKELNNGRLAMIAIAGFVAAELKSPGTEVFQHLFEILDYDLIKEVDLVEDI